MAVTSFLGGGRWQHRVQGKKEAYHMAATHVNFIFFLTFISYLIDIPDCHCSKSKTKVTMMLCNHTHIILVA